MALSREIHQTLFWFLFCMSTSWFIQKLRSLCILLTQVVSNLSATTGPLFGMESWARFPKERKRLFKLITDTKVCYLSLFLKYFPLVILTWSARYVNKQFCNLNYRISVYRLWFYTCIWQLRRLCPYISQVQG